LLFPRSSIANKDITLSNSVGVIDAGYRGELMAKFKSIVPSRAKKYNVGDKIIQLIIIPIPEINLVVSETLSETERGNGGFGSSGQ
jgi:dUTP pyrophosphatase